MRSFKTPEPKPRHYNAHPMVWDYILSDKFYNVICSARGEGKSTSSLMSIVMHANKINQSYWPIKWAVVRDTRKNLGLTTAHTIKEWFPPGEGSFWRGKEEEPEKCSLYQWPEGREFASLYFFGVDSLSDLNRFQSFEAGGVWIEEPAAAADLSSGVSGDVLAIAVTSVRGSPNPRIMISMNPPDENHWVAQIWQLEGGTYDEEALPQEVRDARAEIRANSKVVMLPTGVNKTLDADYHARNRSVLLAAGRGDLVSRLVEGKVGFIQTGEKVAPEFCSAHVDDSIIVNTMSDIIFCWDFGLYPSCFASQITPSGYWNILSAWSVPNIGVKQMAQQYVRPCIQRMGARRWYHIGDPAGMQREQADSERTAVRELIKELGGVFMPGPKPWEARRQAMHNGLSRYHRGVPWIRVHGKDARVLVRALDGGWCYPKTPAGEVVRDQPPKGKQSHIGDAFSYGCSVLLRRDESSQQPTGFTPRAERRLQQQRQMVAGTRTGA